MFCIIPYSVVVLTFGFLRPRPDLSRGRATKEPPDKPGFGASHPPAVNWRRAVCLPRAPAVPEGEALETPRLPAPASGPVCCASNPPRRTPNVTPRGLGTSRSTTEPWTHDPRFRAFPRRSNPDELCPFPLRPSLLHPKIFIVATSFARIQLPSAKRFAIHLV